jgi:hypothetical protein
MMSPVRRTLCSALLAAIAAFVAACGGSSGDGDALTRAQFIAKTDRLCQASNRRTRALNLQLNDAAARSRDDTELLRRLAPILERGYGPVRDNAAAFQAANPPAGDAAAIERIRKAYDEQAELVRRLAAAARRDDIDAFKTLSVQQKDVVTRARTLARAYGFEECGSSKSDPA